MSRTKTGTENGFRVINDGVMEPKRQKAEIQSRMFQFNHTKMNRKRKKK